jgi:hypothetical protein
MKEKQCSLNLHNLVILFYTCIRVALQWAYISPFLYTYEDVNVYEIRTFPFFSPFKKFN